MKKRILITGTSGVGKSKLAYELSKIYKIPFVETNILKTICRCYSGKIKSHQDLINFMKLNPEEGAKIQWELLLQRQIKFGNHYNSGFVTDRGHIDSWVYTSLQVLPYMEESSKERFIGDFVKKFTSVQRLFTHIIYIPYPDNWELEDNNIRVYNPTFQRKVDFLYKDVLRTYLRRELIHPESLSDTHPLVFEMGEVDLEKRIEVCKSFLI